MKNIATLLGLVLAFTLTGCIDPLPKVAAGKTDPAAEALLQAAVEAHGGENFDKVQSITIELDGTWLNDVWKFQPELVDRAYRGSSVETYTRQPDQGWVVEQTHTGPDGEKFVRWSRSEGIEEVIYDGKSVPKDMSEARDAAGMVADAYLMFLTAPFYLKDHPDRVSITMAEPTVVVGRECDQILVRLEPGLDHAKRDHVLLAVDRETKRVSRIRFSLNGYDGTRNATADVEVSDYIEKAGVMWPTDFLEIVRYPIDLEVHIWELLDIKVDSAAATTSP
jgi:hypothetical protein